MNVDIGTFAIGNVLLMPLIVSLIQFFKRFTSRPLEKLWLALSFLFGVAGEVVIFFVANGQTTVGWVFATWAAAIVLGLQFGLAASKAYDEANKSTGVVGDAVRGIAGQ